MPESDHAMEFDARALFQHLVDDLGADPNDEYEWVFRFSHPDTDKLQSTMESIADTFASEVTIDPSEPIGSFDDAPILEDENGRQTTGPPELTIEFYGLINESTLSRLHQKFCELTKRLGVHYLGADCY